MEQLGGFTYQASFISLLQRKFGGTNVREKYIDSNKMYLDGNDMAVLNDETIKYKSSTSQGAILITSLSTFSALILGIAMLPSRRSPVKFTAVGFGTGIFLSYGFWRFQLYRYEEKINHLFHKVIREQYEEIKGQRI
jgi:heme/copper-type cytochrome/quinol oxidase subunit 3